MQKVYKKEKNVFTLILKPTVFAELHKNKNELKMKFTMLLN